MQTKCLLSIAVLSVIAVGSKPAGAQIGFAENQADRIRLWNADYYEIVLRKADGRMMYMIDKTTGQAVSPGNVHGPWVLRFGSNSWLDGQSFSPTNASRQFTYTWDAAQSTLTLDYLATGAQACHVTITVKPTLGPEVDTQLSVTNQWNQGIELLAYPVQFSFRRSQIDGVYVPYQEGMRLLPNFFESYVFGNRYPGQMFADFAYTDLTVGSFAIFGLHDPATPIKPADWLILRDDSYAGGVSKYHHDYELSIDPGAQWTSPTIVLSIGSSLEDAMASYWTRSGHDAMPTLADKLGGSLLDQLAHAVLIKLGFAQNSWTFASFQSFMPTLPADNLLHLVSFWPVGFDENYPDYLPPNPAYGSLTALQSLVAAARASGHLVMPYTNPTWWDDQSPTLASLGTGIVARDRSGSLISETYNTHGGYVVSPHSAAVITRQDQTRAEFTQTVPCDFLFEDQIGARQAPKYADHPDAPDPMQYTQGIIDVAARSATYLPIMSEGGFDRLSWHESGFCNSQRIGWHSWPDSTYTVYPMVPLWAHEHLYFNMHNLAGNVMANDLPALTYFVSMGYNLSHDLSMLDLDWLNVLDRYQKSLVASLMGVDMTAFSELATPGRTQTEFSDGTVITANLAGSAMNQGNHVIVADGFIAERSGSVLGGVFTTLHGQALSGAAPHYLVFNYADYRIEIFQPRGDNGLLTVPRPVSWTDDDRIRATAVTTTGSTFNRPVTIQSTMLQVDYLGSISGQAVKCFLLIYCQPGDADCDGALNLLDHAAFADCVAGPGAIISPTPPRSVQDCVDAFDMDADLDIDLRDFAEFQGLFTGDN